MISIRPFNKILPVLKDPSASGPQEVYYTVRTEKSSEFGSEPNITIIPPSRLGEEFAKTYGHYHKHGEKETYRFLYGTGLVLIQKVNSQGQIESVKALQAEQGQTIEVPAGYGHALINTGDDLLITADWESEEAGHEYEQITTKHGMAYYVVEKDGNIEFEKNPNYGTVPKIETIGF